MSSNKIKPPEDISPGGLFRRLLAKKPKASLEISFLTQMFADGEAPSLEVIAVPSVEIAEAFDHQSPEMALVVKTLYCNGAPAFSTVQEISDLFMSNEVSQLVTAVTTVLSNICPTYIMCDIEAWDAKLQEGAKNNYHVAMSLEGCHDVASTMEWVRTIDRPERYWGIPRCELLDAHWMVYRASREVVDRERKKISPSPSARGKKARAR